MLTVRLLQVVFISACITMLSCEDAPVKATDVTVAAVSSSLDLKEPLSSTLPTTTPTVTSTQAEVATVVPSIAVTQHWNVTDSEGHVCILLQSAIRMTFRYKDEDSKEVTEATDIPTNAVVEGECGSEIQTISLRFYNHWNLTFEFALNGSSSDYRLTNVFLYYNIQTGRWPFPNARSFSNSSVEAINDAARDFHTKSGTSSVCTSEVILLNSSSPGFGLLRVDLYDTRLEAFRGNATNTDFSAMGSRCSNDELSLLIPIVVGACLAGLIVVVLVAYFIGRQRSKKRDYINV